MPDPISHDDLQFLHRAVRLAMNGRGDVEPNPMVGCVIVKQGRVIGEGFHERFGGPHAEPNALQNCKDSPAGATAYVTLEPCCHTNKKTPPCVPALIAAKVARVVVGCHDPHPQVSGQGISQLREADVVVDLAEDAECRQLLAPFIATTVHHRPYITLKWAQSADGKVAGPGGKRVQISNAAATRAIHELRGRCDAILIGIGTAMADDPLLTVRGAKVHRPLMRIVLDSDLRLPLTSRLVHSTDRGKVVVFCSKEAADYSGTRSALAACGVEIHAVPSLAPRQLNLSEVVKQIGQMGVTHLLVEPGPTLARSFFETELWDRAWIIRSPAPIDAADARRAPEGPRHAIGSVDLQGDTLSEYLNAEGICFGAYPSADMLRVLETS